jgi:glyoxylase-like metal-dependent hydrolase (beta-lactamase superfamily II)
MKLSKEETVYQLTFLPGFFPVNCFLIEEQTELTLIDTGIPSSYKEILHVIEKLDKPLTNILLTHAHGDHVGSLDELKRKFPDVPVSISTRDSRLLKGDKTLDSNESQLPIKGGFTKSLKTQADRLLEEGDRIGSLQVVATPGHTPGSISFLDTRNQAIIVGDAMQTRGGTAVSGQIRPLFPFPAFGTWDKELAIESVKKIEKLKPSLIAVGHGDMIKKPVILIQKAIHQAEKSVAAATKYRKDD